MSNRTGTVEVGRLAHEHLLVEILSKARTAGAGAESVRTLGRLTISVIRKFLNDHGAADAPYQKTPGISLGPGRDG